ncbi:MAG: acyl-CoA dehydrogenase family protein [Acidimicrobiales bacterium]|nr:acyl-CoA dehydrogenase family protein [Acidimicrobiales bacterium]
MDFTLTSEQELLRDTARSLLARECPSSLVRAHMEDRSVAAELWRRHLASWAELSAAPSVDLCLFCEQLGAALAPGPFLADVALFQPLVRAAGLDPAAFGSGTVALAGRDGLWQANDDPVRTFVLDVDLVQAVAIVSSFVPRGGAEQGSAGVQLAVIDADAVDVRPIETLDSTRRTYEIDVPDVDRSAGVVRAELDGNALRDIMVRATVALSAELIGVAGWLVRRSVDYAKERVQFDRPIGSFQGLQYKLVDMALAYERATAAVYYAAMALDADDPDRYRAAHVAKAAAGTAARHAAKDGLQVHGGIGYTWEHDLHLYLRRAYASDYLLGPASWHHDRLADLLLA